MPVTKMVSVTYKAPPGDSKVVEMFGHTLFDGKEESVELTEREFEKLKGNRSFKVGEPKDVEKHSDPAKEKAASEAAKKEDDAKKEAQGGNPPQRGALLHKPETDDEKRAREKEEKEADHAKTEHKPAEAHKR